MPSEAFHKSLTEGFAKGTISLLMVMVLEQVERNTHHPVLDTGSRYRDSELGRRIAPYEFCFKSRDFELESIALFKDDFERRFFGHVRVQPFVAACSKAICIIFAAI